MNRIMKGVAAVSAGALSLTGLAGISLLTASSASAATSTNTISYTCSTVTNLGTFGGAATNYTIDLTAPNSVLPGQDVVATGTITPPLKTGPVALDNFSGKTRIDATYQVNGSGGGSLTGAQGPAATAPNVPANSDVPMGVSGAITVPGGSLVDGDVVTILPTFFYQDLTSTSAGGVTGTTTCTPAAAGTNALTVNVLAAATFSVTAVSGQTAANVARSGQTATVSGSSWGPSNGNTVSRQWCDAAGANCSASVAAPGVTIAGGTLSGTVAVGGAGLGTGSRTLRLTADTSGQSTIAPITILGTRSATISPVQGGNGTDVTVTVTNFDTGSTITAFGASAVTNISAGAPGCAPACNITIPTTPTADVSAPAQQGTADATGGGSAVVTITDPATIAVDAVQGASLPATPWGPSTPVGVIAFGTASPSGNFTYGVNSCSIDVNGLPAPQCSNIEFLQMQVDAGDLTLSQDPANATVTLSTITLNGSNQISTGSVNGPSSLSIVDARGTDVGWSITGGLTDFSNTTVLTGPNRTIPATNMSWTPACSAVAPTTGTAVPAATQNFATGTLADPGAAAAVATAPLCSVAAGEGGGTFTADADLNLLVPPTVKTGLYTATLYLQIA